MREADSPLAFDVVVVGSGTGLLAAVAAGELGLRVLVAEKSEYLGGSTATTGPQRSRCRAATLAPRGGSVIDGLYATGNRAGNAFGSYYPGPGATIGQGLVFGYIAAVHAAGKLT